MWAGFTGERERDIRGAFALAVNDWAERTHTGKPNPAQITLSH